MFFAEVLSKANAGGSDEFARRNTRDNRKRNGSREVYRYKVSFVRLWNTKLRGAFVSSGKREYSTGQARGIQPAIFRRE